MEDNLSYSMETLDRSFMFQKIAELPDQLMEGWRIGGNEDPGIEWKKIRSVVLAGMGGSAIAGDIVRCLLGDGLPFNLAVNRQYDCPGYLGPETLFIASSYSGETEETLSSTRIAIERKCPIVSITSGGTLEKIAGEMGFPVFKLPPGYPPRAALGYSLGVLLRLFSAVDDSLSGSSIESDVAFLQDQAGPWIDPGHHENGPLKTAKKLVGRLPILYASGTPGEAVALRWKAQLNENSKTHAFSALFPEMNHNEIMGWQALKETSRFYQEMAPVFLRFPEDHGRIKLRMDITRQLITETGVDVLLIDATGDTLLQRMLSLTLYGDLVSYYLAMFYGLDPTEIPNIQHLKRQLSQSQ